MKGLAGAVGGVIAVLFAAPPGLATPLAAGAQTTGLHLAFPTPPIASAGSIPIGGSLTFILRSRNGTAAAPDTTVYICQCLDAPNKAGGSVPGDATTVPSSQCGGVTSLPTNASLLQCVTNSKGEIALTYHTPGQTVAQGQADWEACLTTSCSTKALAHYVYCTVFRFDPSPIATPGTLAAGQSVSMTLTAKDGLNNPVHNATVYLSFKHTSGGGAASVNGVPLTTSPHLFVTNASGSLTVTYTAPPSPPKSGIDVITATNETSGPHRETVTDSYDFTAGDPVISISDDQVVEGDQNPAIPAEFTVTISPPQATATTFQYVTLCGIGDKYCGEDFVQVDKPITVTIPAGANYAYCTAPSSPSPGNCSTSSESQLDVKQFAYVGSGAGETFNEGWYVEIENPSAGVVGRAVADGLLLPDIEGVTQPLADLYTGNASAIPNGDPSDPSDTSCAAGGNVPMFFTVTLGAATTTHDVTFHYATSDGTATKGVDYVPASGTATIAASYGHGGPGHQTSAIIPVCLLPGAQSDTGKTLKLTISDAQGGDGNVKIPAIYQTGTGTILDPNAV